MIDTIVEQYLKEQEETKPQSVNEDLSHTSQKESQITDVSVKMLKLKERTETTQTTEKVPVGTVVKEEDYSYSYSYEEEIEKEIFINRRTSKGNLKRRWKEKFLLRNQRNPREVNPRRILMTKRTKS
jgi:hypothetical protein